MTAEIVTLDKTVFDKLKKLYGGKRGIIGCEKVHINAKYEQTIATCTWRAFSAL